jgi:hypothetical protein
MGWLRTFQGGLFVTCGLDQFGAPSNDAGEELGLHGRIGNTPARAVCYGGRWIDDTMYELRVAGEVRQARMFGENLVLRREILTALGSNTIRIHDTVTNEGFDRQPHMILYHFNLGFPLIGETARLHLPVEHTTPRDPAAEAGLATWHAFEPPTAGYQEQVFRHAVRAESDGRVHIAVSNPEAGLLLRLRYWKEELPELFQWKMMGEGTYVLGIEPANSSGIEGRRAARDRGDLPYLEPGESRTYRLEVEVGDDARGW